MKRITILLPDKLYEEIKKLKDEGKIKSMSEFLRNLIAYAWYINGKNNNPIPRIQNDWRPIKRRELTPEERGWVSYRTDVRAELMTQLKKVLAERRRRLQKLVKS